MYGGQPGDLLGAPVLRPAMQSQETDGGTQDAFLPDSGHGQEFGQVHLPQVRTRPACHATDTLHALMTTLGMVPPDLVVTRPPYCTVSCNGGTFTLPQLGDQLDRAAPGTLRTGIPSDNLGGVPKIDDVEDPPVHPEIVPTSSR